MAKTVETYIDELKKENKKVHYLAYLMIAVLISVLVVSFLRQYYLTFILLILALAIQLFVFRRAQKNYIKHCENANIALTVMNTVGASEIEERGNYLTEDMISKAHIIPFVPKTFTQFKAIKGAKNGVTVSTTDISLVDRKNEKGIAAEVNTGNWIHLELPKESGFNAHIVEDELMTASSRNAFFGEDYKEMPLPEGFPKRFHIYIENNDEEQKISEGFLSKLKSLSDYTPGKIGVRVMGNEADIFIKNRFLAAGFSAKEDVNEKALARDPFPELKHVLDMVEFI